MITPLTLNDVEHATDDEIVAAYIRDGETEEGARAYLAMIRNTDRRFVVD
ncbi:hypothetical protein [Agromyces albus]|nr:hypothetical protein [Agromyces albus]MDQ0576452.1 hypothetical protein [Agromyces albus]